MHGQPPNRLVIANNFSALQPFARDASAPRRNASAAGPPRVVLRVRFLYLINVGRAAVHVHSNAYELVMQPLLALPAAVRVQSECGARGFVAPDSHLPPAQGGAVLEVVVLPRRPDAADAGDAPARVCTWRCQPPYIKTPWNALAQPRSANRTAGGCSLTPPSFTALALSFKIFLSDFEDSSQPLEGETLLQVLGGLDAMASRLAEDVRERYGIVQVILTLRNASAVTQPVQSVLSWISDLDPDDTEVSESESSGAEPGPGRRLLAAHASNASASNASASNASASNASASNASASNASFASNAGTASNASNASNASSASSANASASQGYDVDALIMAPRSEQVSCCLAASAMYFQQRLQPADYEFGRRSVSLGEPKLDGVTVATKRAPAVTQRKREERQGTRTDSGGYLLLFMLLLLLMCACTLMPRRATRVQPDTV